MAAHGSQKRRSDLAHQIEDALGLVAPWRRVNRAVATRPALFDGWEHLAELPPPPDSPRRHVGPAKPRPDTSVLPRPIPPIDELIGASPRSNAQINRLATRQLDALGPRVDRLDRELRQVRLDADRLRLMPPLCVHRRSSNRARRPLGGSDRIRGDGGEAASTRRARRYHGALVQLVRTRRAWHRGARARGRRGKTREGKGRARRPAPRYRDVLVQRRTDAGSI